MNQIQVRGIICEAYVGVPSTERKQRQKLLVDVSLQADLSGAIASDDFRQTIDYLEVVEKVRTTVASRAFSLIETVGGEICDTILRDPRVQSTSVTVRKFPANLQDQIEHVAVTIARSK